MYALVIVLTLAAALVTVMLAWFASTALGLLLHEFAHACVGLLVGFQIREIRIGSGRPILTLRLRETTLLVNNVWNGGWVRCYPRRTTSRIAEFAFAAAGPAANGLILAILVHLCRSDTLPRGMLVFVLPAMAAQIFLLYPNLRPATLMLFGEALPNDGLLILNAFRATEQRNDILIKHYVADMNRNWNGVAPAPKLSEASARLAYYIYERTQYFTEQLDQEAIDALSQEIARGLHPAEETLVLDHLATDALKKGDKSLLPQLDAWSARALQLNPQRATLKGTRGAALVQIGRYEEALVLLAEADYSDAFNTILNRLFMAQARHRQGQTAAAHAEFAETLSVHGSDPLLRNEPIRRLLEQTAEEIGHPIEAERSSALR